MSVAIISPSPIPSVSGLYELFRPHITFPSTIVGISGMPTIPAQPFPTVNCPSVALGMAATDMQSFQLLTTQMNMLAPMAAYLGVAVADLIPDIPGLGGFNLITILALDPEALLAAVRGLLGFAGWPFTAYPLYGDLNAPDFSDLQTMRSVVHSYAMTLVGTISDVIGSVAQALQIPGMGALPTFPSYSDVIQLALANLSVPDISTAVQAINSEGIPAGDMFAGLAFPGFPSVYAPEPRVFQDVRMTEVEVQEHLMGTMGTLCVDPMSTMKDFISSNFGSIGPFDFSLSACALEVAA